MSERPKEVTSHAPRCDDLAEREPRLGVRERREKWTTLAYQLERELTEERRLRDADAVVMESARDCIGLLQEDKADLASRLSKGAKSDLTDGWRERAYAEQERADRNERALADSRGYAGRLEALLKRLYGWDMMDVASDGKYWRTQIAEALVVASGPFEAAPSPVDPATWPAGELKAYVTSETLQMNSAVEVCTPPPKDAQGRAECNENPASVSARVHAVAGHNVVVTLPDGASAVFLPSCEIAIEVAKRLAVNSSEPKP